MIYNFDDQLAYSRGVRESTDLETIKAMIPGCVEVIKTDERQDKAGVDYIAMLRRGAMVLIDAKARQPGCSRYWKQGPELALELWSVREHKKPGWTLCEKKDVDYILFTFDPSDSTEVFLYPFQLLRSAFVHNVITWGKEYRTAIQKSDSWTSQCVFVPEKVTWSAIRQAMRWHTSVTETVAQWTPSMTDIQQAERATR